MRATFFGLEIGRTGLSVSQVAMDVTGHNIANVDTLGYSRQRIVSTAYDPNAIRGKLKPIQSELVGGGSLVRVHEQIRSAFLDRQFRTEQSLYSYWETRSQGLTFVRGKFENSDANLALSQNIQKLFRSFLAETEDTSGKDPRVIIRESAETMMLQFSLLYDGLIDLQARQDDSYVTQIGEINTYADNLAAINEAIYSFELLSNEYANDLRDKRNLLLDQLSEIADITYETASDGKFTVKLAGEVLVNHVTVNKLGVRTEPNAVAGEPDVHNAYWTHLSNPAAATPVYTDLDFTKLRGGTLKSTKDLRDIEESTMPGIPYFIEQLNTLVRGIVKAVNDQHKLGYTYPAQQGDLSKTGINFFDDFGDITKVTAKNLQLSADIIANVANIATSEVPIQYDPAGPVPDYMKEGNNENIKKISRLFGTANVTFTLSNGDTITNGIGDFLTGIGVELFATLNHSDETLDTLQIQLIDVENQRQAIMGVSLDEEMTSLMKYTHAYNGAARVITAMDEAIDVLINRMGRVGL